VGQVAEGLTQMREGLAALRAMGAEVLHPYLLALLADACGCGGQIEAGLGALEEALVTAGQHAELFYEAELYRLKGELLLRRWREAGAKPAPRVIQQSHAASGETTGRAPLQMEVEACFQRALAIAQRQGIKSLELRAALSLSRLWQQQGKRAAARQLLAEVYGWFTEGFETADLQEAQALLEVLV
jgi:predicted ATPase